MLDWIACKLVFDRPVTTKQLFLYGEADTLLLHLLRKVLRIYSASCQRGTNEKIRRFEWKRIRITWNEFHYVTLISLCETTLHSFGRVTTWDKCTGSSIWYFFFLLLDGYGNWLLIIKRSASETIKVITFLARGYRQVELIESIVLTEIRFDYFCR